MPLKDNTRLPVGYPLSLGGDRLTPLYSLWSSVSIHVIVVAIFLVLSWGLG